MNVIIQDNCWYRYTAYVTIIKQVNGTHKPYQ